MTDRDGLDIWVIYQNTTDFPGMFVLRKQTARSDKTIEIDSQAMVCEKIEPLQNMMIDRGLVKLMRHPDDDPAIVETWL